MHIYFTFSIPDEAGHTCLPGQTEYIVSCVRTRVIIANSKEAVCGSSDKVSISKLTFGATIYEKRRTDPRTRSSDRKALTAGPSGGFVSKFLKKQDRMKSRSEHIRIITPESDAVDA